RKDQVARLRIEYAERSVRHGTGSRVALEDGDSRNGRVEEPIRFDGAVEVGVIVSLLDRLRNRKAVLERVAGRGVVEVGCHMGLLAGGRRANAVGVRQPANQKTVAQSGLTLTTVHACAFACSSACSAPAT